MFDCSTAIIIAWWPLISYNRKILSVCLVGVLQSTRLYPALILIPISFVHSLRKFLERCQEDSLKIIIFNKFIRSNNKDRKDLTAILRALIQSASRPLSNWSHSKWRWSIRLCGFHIGDYKFMMSASWPLDSEGENFLTNRHAPKHQSPTMVRTARPPDLDSTQPNIPISVSCRSALFLGQKRGIHCISLHANCPCLFVLHQPSPSTSLNRS